MKTPEKSTCTKAAIACLAAGMSVIGVCKKCNDEATTIEQNQSIAKIANNTESLIKKTTWNPPTIQN